MQLGTTIPVLRIFDEAKALEFYRGFLGFKVDWEHRFEADFPLYLQVSRDGCVLHLSEHHGDACPGALVRVRTSGLEALHRELTDKRYRMARPELVHQPWGNDLAVSDPFGNRLIFSDAGTDASNA